MSTQDKALLSPEQAAKAVGLSRWTILRAIKAQRLQAIRDNKGNWRIAPDDLSAWAAAHAAQGASSAERERSEREAQAVADAKQRVEMELRVALGVETARADAAERARDQAEADRDHWRALVGTLSARRRWWPW